MDSLLATYASSDDEDEQPPPPPQKPPQPQSYSKPTSSLFSSPSPSTASSSSSSRLFSSLPPPKPSSRDSTFPPSKPSSLFSLLPPPKSQTTLDDFPSIIPPSNPKRVVQFHPPNFNKHFNIRDVEEEEDEEDEEEKEKKKKRQMGHDTSVKSFLSTIPAPKNSDFSALGASGGRRSIIDAAGPVSTAVVDAAPVAEVGVDQNVGISQENEGDVQQYDAFSVYNYNYDAMGYGNYEGYEQQYYDGNSWNTNNSGNDSVLSSGVDSFMNMGGGGGGKRRKDQIPAEIVEVKQDELMKNRPTEDKSKLTGNTFGPSYQPVSSKGKPSKLHKKKHQIGSLYFDMKQNAMELEERRAKGFLTKSETQAKYGW